MEIKHLAKTNLDLYLIDRGNGREVVHTAYYPQYIEERIKEGKVRVYPVPDEVRDELIAFCPEIWAMDKLSSLGQKNGD